MHRRQSGTDCLPSDIRPKTEARMKSMSSGRLAVESFRAPNNQLHSTGETDVQLWKWPCSFQIFWNISVGHKMITQVMPTVALHGHQIKSELLFSPPTNRSVSAPQDKLWVLHFLTLLGKLTLKTQTSYFYPPCWLTYWLWHWYIIVNFQHY